MQTILTDWGCNLGGTPETQQDFLGTLSSDPNNAQLSTEKWKSKAPPIANQFALGYTYQDVLDADGEGESQHRSLARQTG